MIKWNEKTYSTRNLRQQISSSDISRYAEIKTEEQRIELCEKASTEVYDCAQAITDVDEFVFGKRTGVKFSKLEHGLIYRLLAKNVAQVYGIRFGNRNHILRNLLSFLAEEHQFSIYRYDIKRFFNTINRESVTAKLKADQKLSVPTLELIFTLFEVYKSKKLSGLPPGLSVNGVLAELYMQDFDESVRSMENVLFYGRFVDDIIAITSPDVTPTDFHSKLIDRLPNGLEFHDKGDKRKYINSSKLSSKGSKKTNHSQSSYFEYLGYKFNIGINRSFPNEFPLKKYAREVKIEIAGEKVNKIKSRLIKSFIRYEKSQRLKSDFDFLEAQVKLLTSNYQIVQVDSNELVKSGIFFNYKFVNDVKQLRELNCFKNEILYSKRRLSKRLANSLSTSQKYKLKKLSFVTGFTERRFYRFSPAFLSKCFNVWS